MKTMKTIKIEKRGTLKIVSSGYSDRFPMTECWINLICDGIKYQVDPNDATRAYLNLSGMEENDENCMTALRLINSPDNKYALSFSEKVDANTTLTVATTANKIRAGIALVTGFPGLNEIGVANAKNEAAALNENELKMIRAALARINKAHAEEGRALVSFIQDDDDTHFIPL